MFYWFAVFALWILSIALISIGTYFGVRYTQSGDQNDLVVAAVTFFAGLVFNFLVVNWPTGGPAGRRLDEKTVKALKAMAKLAPLAPKSVKEGLEKLTDRLS